jgi:hypothetical protein
MIASIFIIAISLILLGYWFRYTCILLLRGGTSSGDRFLQDFQHHLGLGYDKDTSALHEALNKDFALLTYLIEHASAFRLDPWERHLLSWDYRVMNALYRCTRASSPACARIALDEMTSIVRFFARRLGEQATQT